jgi:hypothetical protein
MNTAFLLRLSVCALLATAMADAAPAHFDPSAKQRLKARTLAGDASTREQIMACLLDGYSQRLPLATVLEQCSDVAISRAEGADPVGGALGPKPDPFSPKDVVGACGGGKSVFADGIPPSGSLPSTFIDPDTPSYGSFSWGDCLTCKGLSFDEAAEAKYQAMKEANRLAKEFEKKFNEWFDAKDPAEKDRLDKETQEAADEFLEAAKAAQKDPNHDPAKGTVVPDQIIPDNVASTSPDGVCQAVLDNAREFLRECKRVQWKSAACEEFRAKHLGCPDPLIAYVDPEQGLVCPAPADPAAVIEAWTAKCEQNTTPGPDGGSSCRKPEPVAAGIFQPQESGDLCNDPQALVTGDSCIVPLEVDDFGQPDVGEVIAMALDRFGGPIFVLPKPNPPPHPGGGPQPWPGPR